MRVCFDLILRRHVFGLGAARWNPSQLSPTHSPLESASSNLTLHFAVAEARNTAAAKPNRDRETQPAAAAAPTSGCSSGRLGKPTSPPGRWYMNPAHARGSCATALEWETFLSGLACTWRRLQPLRSRHRGGMFMNGVHSSGPGSLTCARSSAAAAAASPV